jgi:tetratricopeptide (TPR) repeat protein
MLGKFDDAKKNVEQAKAAADRNAGNAGIRDGYLGMRARLISDSGQWEKLALEAPAARRRARQHAGHAGMAAAAARPRGPTSSESAPRRPAISATAEKAEAALKALTANAQGGPTSYAAKPHVIREKELGAVIRWAKGQKDEALQFAKEAADAEKAMSAPSGPPEPIKPAYELYGEMLLEAGKAKDAMSAFEQSLLRTPKRTPSVLGLARAAAAAGDQATARPAIRN